MSDPKPSQQTGKVHTGSSLSALSLPAQADAQSSGRGRGKISPTTQQIAHASQSLPHSDPSPFPFIGNPPGLPSLLPANATSMAPTQVPQFKQDLGTTFKPATSLKASTPPNGAGIAQPPVLFTSVAPGTLLSGSKLAGFGAASATALTPVNDKQATPTFSSTSTSFWAATKDSETTKAVSVFGRTDSPQAASFFNSFVKTTINGNMFNDKTYSDLNIVLPERKEPIYCHKIVLCQNSLYFQKLCGPDAKLREHDSKTITLIDDDPEAVMVMLQFLYTGRYHSEKLKGPLWKAHYRTVLVAEKYLVNDLAGIAANAFDFAINIIVKVPDIFAIVKELASAQLPSSLREFYEKFEKGHMLRLVHMKEFEALMETDKELSRRAFTCLRSAVPATTQPQTGHTTSTVNKAK